jgi:hypothetical protein
MGLRREYREGYGDARIRSHKAAIVRACAHGIVIGVALFYPAAIWKRILGAVVAFFVIGVIVQFVSMRRQRRAEHQ